MIRDDLAAMIESAAQAAMEAGELPQVVLPDLVIERPAKREHGDYATNLPMRLARAARANPVDIAKAIAARIPLGGGISAAEVAPPGFINFRLSEPWLAQQAPCSTTTGPVANFFRAPPPHQPRAREPV